MDYSNDNTGSSTQSTPLGGTSPNGVVTHETLLEDALSYVARGWRVFPLRPRTKLPYPGFSWPQLASTDPDEIRGTWATEPDSNIGIVTGKTSNLTVLDFDGQQEWEDFLALHDELGIPHPTGPVVRTGRPGGGYQAYYPYEPRVKQNAGKIRAGWDVRNDGGYVVAAPSVHPSGNRYEFLQSPDKAPLTPMPEPLVAWWAAKQNEKHTPGSHPADGGGVIPHGVQEAELTRLAGVLHKYGFTEDEAFSTIYEVGTKRCDPPVLEKDIRRMVESIYRNAKETPEVPPELIPVPDFPIDVFDPLVAEYLTLGAQGYGAPMDFIAVPFLSIVGGAMGNTWALRLKKSTKPLLPNLWTAVVGKPGSRKSPAFDHARRPLNMLQADANEQFFHDQRAYEEAAKAGKDPGPEPRETNFYTTDTTIEKLGAMLADSAGLTVVADELSGFIKSHDQYRGKGGDREKYMSLWAGADQKIDRKGAPSIHISNPVVSISGGIQPDLLKDLTKAATADGFIDRFLFTWPNTKPQEWNDDDPDIQESYEHVCTIFRRLRLDVPVEVTLDPAARAIFVSWYRTNEVNISTASGLQQGMYSKALHQLGAIALILHALQSPDSRQVSAQTLANAITVLEYFQAHAQRVLAKFSQLGTQRMSNRDAEVIRAIGKCETEWVARRELRTHLSNQLTAEDVDELIAGLETRGIVETRTVSTQGRPRREVRVKPNAIPEPQADTRTPLQKLGLDL